MIKPRKIPRIPFRQTGFLLAAILLFLTGCGKRESARITADAPQRLIALAPNLTATLDDLNLGDRIVGITRFSDPGENQNLPIVGDFMNLNYEAIFALKPDLVLLEKSADAAKSRLDALGIPYLETASLTLEQVFETIQALGKACHAESAATELTQTFRAEIERARNKMSRRPRTLICFGDLSGTESIEQVYAFGADCIHSELLQIAGGDNVVKDARPSVALSREAIIRLNPELIIELTPGGSASHWESLPSVEAVRNHRIHVLTGNYTTIPSPRNLMKTLNDLAEIILPLK